MAALVPHLQAGLAGVATSIAWKSSRILACASKGLSDELSKCASVRLLLTLQPICQQRLALLAARHGLIFGPRVNLVL